MRSTTSWKKKILRAEWKAGINRFATWALIDEYRRWSLAFFDLNAGIHQWNQLGLWDQQHLNAFRGFSATQKLLYFRFVAMERGMAERAGEDNFDQVKIKYVWNWVTWTRVIYKVIRATSPARLHISST